MVLENLLFVVVLVLGLALAVCINRLSKMAREPKVEVITQESSHVVEAVTPSAVGSTFTRKNVVEGVLSVNGIEYDTYDFGELTICTAKGKPFIEFSITGANNQQREVGYITIHDPSGKKDSLILDIDNVQEDSDYFERWLQARTKEPAYKSDIAYYRTLMQKIAYFNSLLASGKVRKQGSGYKWTGL